MTTIHALRRITMALALIATSLSWTSTAQQTQKLTASKANEFGLIYNLPITAFDITFEIRYTEKMPGEFMNYTRRYFDNIPVVTEPEQSVELVSVTVSPIGLPNKNSQWLVQFKPGTIPVMILNDASIPLSVNLEDITLPPSPTLPIPQPATPTPLQTEAASQAITLEMNQSSSVSKRAELAAQRIYELRDMRNEVISGQSDASFPDGAAMQLALDNMAAQEAALMAMFTGVTTTHTDISTVRFTPDATERTNTILARISPLAGVVDPTDLSGQPVYLTYTIREQGKLPVNDKGITKSFPKGGLAYNIPGVASLSISYNGKTYYAKSVDVAQLGVTFGLDPDIFTDKKFPAFVRFNPTTGGILEIGTKNANTSK